MTDARNLTEQQIANMRYGDESAFDSAGTVKPARDNYWQGVSDDAMGRWNEEPYYSGPDMAYLPHPSDAPDHWVPAPKQPELAREDNPVTDDYRRNGEWPDETPRQRAIRELSAEFGTDESEWF